MRKWKYHHIKRRYCISEMRTGVKHIRYLKLALMGSVFFFAHELHAQDLHFSQFFEAPLLRNPALAGLFEGDVSAKYRFKILHAFFKIAKSPSGIWSNNCI